MSKRVKFIEQMEHSECGLASMAMLLNYHGHEITLTEMRERYGVSKRGSSLADLLDIGDDFHLKCNVYKGSLEDLSSSLPVILHWKGQHYVVLERLGKRNATIIDPDNGRHKIPLSEVEQHYSGYIFAAEPSGKFETRHQKSKWSFFLRFIQDQSKLITSLIVFSFLLQGLGFLIPQLTQWITDQVIIPSNKEYLTVLGIGVLGLFLFHQIFSYLRSFFIVKLQTNMDYALMSTFISRLFHLPFPFFESRKSGELVFRANSNVHIRQILSSKVISLVIDSILVVSYACLLLYQEWRLGLIIISLSSLLFVVLSLSTRLTRKLTDQQISANTKTQAYLTENIFGICDVKVLGAEEKVFHVWQGLFKDQLETNKKYGLLSAVFDTISGGIQFITPLFILWIGAGFVLEGNLTLGQLLGISALSTAFMIPFTSLGSTYSQFLVLGSYIRRLRDVMESTPEGSGGRKDFQLLGGVELKNVSFRYSYFGENVLSSINLTIRPGEKIAIVGESGSGKSTLAKVLLGLYNPQEGNILFDGTPLQEMNLQTLRRQIGVVLQETRLFHGTIQENISLLDDEVPMEQIIHATKRADIYPDIVEQMMGFHTMVSEGGGNFSGGQRQRLLLARALVHQPKMLVLDEATSALDTIRESNIQHSLSKLKCTQVIIAHRLSTVRNCDRIVVMHKGQITEMGTHEELLKNQGVYYQLCRNQGNIQTELT
ncbi:ABC-type bacteriocin/lantibiotic exporter, contains an N-terminal double-glycine peptidase domain [Thermoactinomyces sp. DSM 45891]|uniref:peptidase domain-containing ABC transporter n=1 Tax=Thermoactinomyces sp. DSM 45891 TaxID=1761907 RepID=UPI000914C5E8|nr:peptidase domain-containing ABC transporter [Thermoactinomyces sp. DSM 45891]SFX64872.1 ABC-type bacteriocin/lantibiotic exporter, contains an N-terminal double-glycine peptidase domain [Thermoactinomyces sp. DSM 45891]